MVGYKNAEMALCNQLKMRPNRIVRENTLKNVSPLCQRVTLYFKILCVTVGGNAANGQKKSISVHRL